MKMVSRWAATAAGSLVLSLLAASASVGSPHPPPALAATVASAPAPQGDEIGAEAVRLGLDEYSFEPTSPVARAGTVRLLLENAGLRRHNVVVFVDGVEHASPYLRPGDSLGWDVPIERPGAYRYWCSEYRHLEKGMEGTLTVE